MDNATRNAVQWNPPPTARRCDTPFEAGMTVESATECTGLMMHVPDDEGAADAISELYAIHAIKPARR